MEGTKKAGSASDGPDGDATEQDHHFRLLINYERSTAGHIARQGS